MPSYSVNDDIVSVWAAIRPIADFPKGYFEERYPRDDDEPLTQFCGDFGFEWFDHDNVEANCTEGHESVDVGDLLRPGELSCVETFRDAAIARAHEIGLQKTWYLFLIYNFEYDPEESGIEKSPFMQFVGAFPFEFKLPDWAR